MPLRAHLQALSAALVNHIIVPTPQNTPLTHTPVSAGLSRTTVLDISEDVEPAEETTMPSRATTANGIKKAIEALKSIKVERVAKSVQARVSSWNKKTASEENELSPASPRLSAKDDASKNWPRCKFNLDYCFVNDVLGGFACAQRRLLEEKRLSTCNSSASLLRVKRAKDVLGREKASEETYGRSSSAQVLDCDKGMD
ncbi:hypothetical protein BJV77DRAFT_1151063 [Russula vinacea]|nr:hypothetical protein BJV77DRAFT_1151063 [Russula vinacea]